MNRNKKIHMTQEDFGYNKRHYYWLDLLRFSSALLVVICHYRGNFFIEYGLLSDEDKNIFTQIFYFIGRLGNESVVVFFVLSGFLVGGKALQRILNNEIDVKSFFIDRFTRIMLPLLAALFFMVVITIIVGDPIPFKDILGSLFSLQGIFTGSAGNTSLWTLAYEVWFYIFIGCLMIICRGKNTNNILIAFIVLTICISIFTKLQTRYLLILFMGSFAFLLPRENLKYLKSKIFLLLILLSFSFVLSQLTSETRSLNLSTFSFLERKQISVFLAFIAVLLVHHLVVAKPQKRIWVNVESVSSKFSDFSYTLYLIHYPLMFLLSYLGFPKSEQINTISILYYIVEILISIVVAYLIYLVSEKQTPTVKKYIKRQLTKQKLT
jgi:peptidoglycan/LPS O-acetylase OafA/YrhL